MTLKKHFSLCLLIAVVIFQNVYPQNRNDLFAEGLNQYLNKNYDKSVSVFSSILIEDPAGPENDRVIFWLGKAWQSAGDPAKAARCFHYIIQNYPQSEKLKLAAREFEKLPKQYKYLKDIKIRDLADPAVLQQTSNPAKPVANVPVNENNEVTPGYSETDPAKEYTQSPAPLTPNREIKASSGEIVHAEEPRVNNVFYETDLRQTLLDISSQTGIQIIADNTVQGYASIELNDVPLSEALKRILKPLGYTYQRIDDYYIVGLAVPDNPSFPLLSETRVIRLNYILAADITNMLSDYYKNYIKINERLNTVTITASNEMIEKIEEDLKVLDSPSRQIMIEVLVTEITEERSHDIGIDWDISAITEHSQVGLSTSLHNSNGSPFTLDLTRLKVPYKDYTIDALTRLRALVRSGKAKIKANPKVATLEGQQATFFTGKEEYYAIVSGPVNYPYTTLQKINAGITLTITPYLSDDAKITLMMESEVSDVTGQGTTGLPVISRRSVKTNIMALNGQTIVIGGLKLETEEDIQTKIPVLGSIPVLGTFFRNNQKAKATTEVVIFLTPRILQ